MSKLSLTQHAQTRMQQRAISEMQARLIQEFGQYEYQKGGTQYAFIPEKTLAELRRAIDKLTGVCLLLGESDKVITAMHQNQRVRRTEYAA